MIESARTMLRYGVNPIPVSAEKKTPLVKWKQYQTDLISEYSVNDLFSHVDGIAAVAGKVSGNLECLDFDIQGLFYEAWEQALLSVDPILHDKLLTARTQSGGYHVLYRCPTIEGNRKLLTVIKPDGKVETAIETRGEGGYFLVAPTKNYSFIDGDWSNLTTITPEERELLFKCTTSQDVMDKMTITGHILYVPQAVQKQPQSVAKQPVDPSKPLSPLDSILVAGMDVRALRNAGWEQMPSNDKFEKWKRPDKTKEGASASRNPENGYFRVFSTNAQPFDIGINYSPEDVYIMLEHNGNAKAAAHALHNMGIGVFTKQDKQPIATDIGEIDEDERLYQRFLEQKRIAEEQELYYQQVADNAYEEYLKIPEEQRNKELIAMKQLEIETEDSEINENFLSNESQYIPNELMNVEGLINEFRDYIKLHSHHEQPEICFAGALVMMSFLLGRRVRDEKDVRPVLFADIVSPAGSGKGAVVSAIDRIFSDYQEKYPYRVLSEHLVKNLSSTAALDKVLIERKKILILWDEYASDLKVYVRSLNSIQYQLIKRWVELFSAGGTLTYKETTTAKGFNNKKNKKDKTKIASQPHVTFCGLSNPEEYKLTLTGQSITSGYIPRRFIFWGRNDSEDIESAEDKTVPDSILDTMYLWDYAFAPIDESVDFDGTIVETIDEGAENKASVTNPIPRIIKKSPEAKELLDTFRKILSDFKKSKGCPAVFVSLAERIVEKTRSLILLYTCSRARQPSDLDTLESTTKDVWLAFRLATHLAIQASRYLQDKIPDTANGIRQSNFSELAIKMESFFKNNPKVSKTVLARQFPHSSKKERQEVIDNLIEQGILEMKDEVVLKNKTMYYLYIGRKVLTYDSLWTNLKQAYNESRKEN